MTLVVSAEMLGVALSYQVARRTLDRIGPRLEAVRNNAMSIQDLAVILCDYNSAVESAPMFATGLYLGNRDRLNELWLEHRRS
jgi:hypothetical protein